MAEQTETEKEVPRDENIAERGAREGHEAAQAIRLMCQQLWDHEIEVDTAAQRLATEGVRVAGAMLAIAQGPRMPGLRDGGPPPDFPVPGGLTIPKERAVVYGWLRAEWTPKPNFGIARPGKAGKWRAFIVWELTDSEERIALRRASGIEGASRNYLAQQTIRAIDGHVADWSGDTRESNPGSVDRFWLDVGPKCRALFISMYERMHHMGAAEQLDFFENCVEHAMGG